MKRLPLLLLMASTFACAQTAPVSLPGVTISIPATDLNSLLMPVPGPQGIQGPPGQSIQGPQGLPGKDAVCPTSTVQSYTDILFSMGNPQALDTTAGPAVFATSFSIPANTLKAGILRIHAGGPWALGPDGRFLGYGIEIDGQPLLPALQEWLNASTKGYWHVEADVQLFPSGSILNAAVIGTVGAGSGFPDAATGSVGTIDPTKAHVITVYSNSSSAETGDTATMNQFWLSLN